MEHTLFFVYDLVNCYHHVGFNVSWLHQLAIGFQHSLLDIFSRLDKAIIIASYLLMILVESQTFLHTQVNCFEVIGIIKNWLASMSLVITLLMIDGELTLLLVCHQHFMHLSALCIMPAKTWVCFACWQQTNVILSVGFRRITTDNECKIS